MHAGRTKSKHAYLKNGERQVRGVRYAADDIHERGVGHVLHVTGVQVIEPGFRGRRA